MQYANPGMLKYVPGYLLSNRNILPEIAFFVYTI